MSLKNRLEIKSTLALRLTIWYAGFFSFFILLLFFIFYVAMTSAFLKTMDKALLSEVHECSSVLSLNGMEALKETVRIESEAEGIDTMFYKILSLGGEIIDSSDTALWPQTESKKRIIRQMSIQTQPVFETLLDRHSPYKTRIVYARIGPDTILQVGKKMRDEAGFVDIFKSVFGFSTGLIIFIASFVGWFMSKRALEGVREITKTTRLIGAGNFEKRVQLKNRGDEIEELAITFNEMVERISTLIKEMREMGDNIAHDLKSPVTGIRGMAEITLNSGQSVDDYRKMAGKTIEECDRIVNMVNTMLYISETEAGVYEHAYKELDLSSVLKSAVLLFEPIAEDRNIEIALDVPETLMIIGEKQMLQRMVANIIDNSLKYSFEGGQIAITGQKMGDAIVLIFKDTGMGIAEEHLPHIFKRFYRCDKSRSLPGTGLGLSLVYAIVHAHEGDITVKNHQAGGIILTITFPLKKRHRNI
ncbi:MAG: HAMP domain-containing histidine kinase [Proteobacteria bacterium]|nr:HAMP domain-containing histidine kinase [Pseudomonadota bacterium]